MITTPSMGLIAWNQASDPYSSEELAENWAKVDQHDHTPGKGVPIATGALADASVTAEKIAPGALASVAVGTGSIDTDKLADNAVTTIKIANNTILSGNVANNTLADTKFASPNNGVYKTISWGQGQTNGATATGTFAMGAGMSVEIASGGDVVATNSWPPVFSFNSSDYAVNNLTTVMRLRANVTCNATAPAINYVVGLYPVTVAGGAGALTITLGTVVSGSTTTFNTPSASTVTTNTSGDFAIPANGAYCLGFTTSGSAAANNVSHLTARVQVRNT